MAYKQEVPSWTTGANWVIAHFMSCVANHTYCPFIHRCFMQYTILTFTFEASDL